MQKRHCHCIAKEIISGQTLQTQLSNKNSENQTHLSNKNSENQTQLSNKNSDNIKEENTSSVHRGKMFGCFQQKPPEDEDMITSYAGKTFIIRTGMIVVFKAPSKKVSKTYRAFVLTTGKYKIQRGRDEGAIVVQPLADVRYIVYTQ